MSEPNRCGKCGASLPAGVLSGLCPRCLMDAAFTLDIGSEPRTAKDDIAPAVIARYKIVDSLRKRGARFQVPIEDFAESALDRFWRKVKKGGRHLADIDDEDRHAVRIAAKKLRYGCEFFAPLHDGTKQFITTLADLQEHLGDLNDIVTARILAARFPGIALTDEPDRALLLAAAEKTHIRLTEIGPFWR